MNVVAPAPGRRAVPAVAGLFVAGLSVAGRSLARAFFAERERWVLWLPVLVAFGIGLYFVLGQEPPLWLAVPLVAVPLTALVAVRVLGRRPLLTLIAAALAALAIGFAAAQVRTALVAAPALAKRIGPVMVSGQVIEVEWFTQGLRLTLAKPVIPGLEPAQTPEQVRIRLRGKQPEIHPGAWIRVRAVLAPPPPPAAPGGFDFQRQAFFSGLGGVGYSVGRAEVLAVPLEVEDGGLSLGIERLRARVASRIRDQVSGTSGALNIALLTGERSEIPEPAMQAIRDAGLAHLLAISGLNIGLVAGFVFACVRGGLALIPPIALRYPIKKWAAVISLAAAGFYTVLAGATVPTQRAFLMLAVVLVATLFDRQGISMRLVAFAALVILLLRPEMLLSASFQLSFAAVVALVAGYEWLRVHRVFSHFSRGPGTRLGLYLAATMVTTLVATAATTPIGIYHFQRITWYGLIANMIAVPVTGIWIMPLVVASLCLMPLGLERLALVPMGWGQDVVVWTAETVASWPGAVSTVPAAPLWTVVAFALGGLWLCLWRGRWRWGGLIGVAAAAAGMLTATAPDVLIDGRGKLFAVKAAGGELLLSSRNAAPLTRDAWRRQAGDDEAAEAWPRQGASGDGRLSCDPLGCLYSNHGHTVALARSPAAVDEDCRSAEVVLSTVPVRGSCPAALKVIDRFDLWRNGTHAVWLLSDGIRIASVNGVRGRRPWVARPKAARGGDDDEEE